MAEKEYIEAKELEEFRDKIMEKFLSLCNYNDYNKLTLLRIGETIDEIYDKYCYQSTADVQEVKHGKWVLMGTEMFMDGSHSSKFCCSLCSREVGVCHEHDSDKHKYVKLMYPYCHCGAKMDLVGDDNG